MSVSKNKEYPDNWIGKYDKILTVGGVIVVVIISLYSALVWPKDINNKIKTVETKQQTIEEELKTRITREKLTDSLAPIKTDIGYIKIDISELKRMVTKLYDYQISKGQSNGH